MLVVYCAYLPPKGEPYVGPNTSYLPQFQVRNLHLDLSTAVTTSSFYNFRLVGGLTTLQSKAIAIENDLRGMLRNFGLRTPHSIFWCAFEDGEVVEEKYRHLFHYAVSSTE